MEYLQTSDKFYVNDLGMRNVAIEYDDGDLDGILENVVFMELMFRYGNACVMNVDGKEIDFVSYDADRYPMYFQVSVSVTDLETMRRELAPLRALRDNYPKTVVTLDRCPCGNVSERGGFPDRDGERMRCDDAPGPCCSGHRIPSSNRRSKIGYHSSRPCPRGR